MPVQVLSPVRVSVPSPIFTRLPSLPLITPLMVSARFRLPSDSCLLPSSTLPAPDSEPMEVALLTALTSTRPSARFLTTVFSAIALSAAVIRPLLFTVALPPLALSSSARVLSFATLTVALAAVALSRNTAFALPVRFRLALAAVTVSASVNRLSAMFMVSDVRLVSAPLMFSVAPLLTLTVLLSLLPNAPVLLTLTVTLWLFPVPAISVSPW